MDDCQRKVNQRHEGTKPRKVRFKLAASYSGRVLKHVYEDGQELDSPEEKYPHSFMHRKIPPSHLEVEQLRGFEGMPDDQQDMYPPTGLIAQRINVYRGVGSYRAAAAAQGEPVEPEDKSSVLDFGKIIIYTSNLRIVRAPHRRPETSRHHSVVVTPETHRRPETSRHHSVVVTPETPEVCLPQARERGSRRKGKALSAHGVLVEKGTSDMQDKEVVVSCCQHCGGSGWGAPCSLCHGSKLSMLANRFNESISCLRCQACYPHGLEKCQACSPGK